MKLICEARECKNMVDGACSMKEITLDPMGGCTSASVPDYLFICNNCREGYEKDCPHAIGHHYDVYGEGIEPPDWCPQHIDDLPF